MKKLSFITPETSEHWKAYHAIRREILWEARGRVDAYDENDPADREESNFPKLLLLNDEAIATVRIDIMKKTNEACFRHVAVVQDQQGQGFGTELMSQAEGFALDLGCTFFSAIVSPDSVEFFQKLGYKLDTGHSRDDDNLRMIKRPA